MAKRSLVERGWDAIARVEEVFRKPGRAATKARAYARESRAQGEAVRHIRALKAVGADPAESAIVKVAKARAAARRRRDS